MFNMADNQKKQPTPITPFTGSAESAINDVEKGDNTSITESSPVEAPVEVSTRILCLNYLCIIFQLTSTYT